MNWIWLLIAIELCMVLTTIVLFECDIVSPATMVCLVFLFSTVVLSTQLKEWGVKISLETVLTIFFSLLSFVTVSFIIFKASSPYKRIKCVCIHVISISHTKQLLSLVFEVIICLLFYGEVKRIASYVTQDWGMGLIWRYRQASFYSNILSREDMLNPYIAFGNKILMIIAYIMVYVFVNNVLILGEKIISNVSYLLLTSGYIFITILSGNRLALMNVIIFGLVEWYILNNMKNGRSIKNLFAYIKRFLLIGIALFFGFYSLTTVVQRYTVLPFGKMVAHYAGAPIQLLDEYIKQPVDDNKVWGQESFINIYNSLYKLGLSQFHGILNLEYRSFNGTMLGNVYTSLRRFIQDFGLLGGILAVGLVGLFYSYLYYFVIMKIEKMSTRSNVKLIIFSFMYYPIALFSIEEYFTLMWSLGYIVSLLLINVMFIFYVDTSVRNGILRIRIDSKS